MKGTKGMSWHCRDRVIKPLLDTAYEAQQRRDNKKSEKLWDKAFNVK